jgi:hypothetical protein
MLYFGRVDSLWGHRVFFDSLWGKSYYPKKNWEIKENLLNCAHLWLVLREKKIRFEEES